MRMVRCGFLMGLGFLLAVAVLETVARPGTGPRHGTGDGLDADVSGQVWQVLAEARRIVEESA